MIILINWLVSALAIVITAYLLPGVQVANFTSALLVAIVLGVINAFLKPLLLVLTLPINMLTLGLFTFVINALIIILIANLVPGFKVNGFLWALLFSIVLSIINSIFSALGN